MGRLDFCGSVCYGVFMSKRTSTSKKKGRSGNPKVAAAQAAAAVAVTNPCLHCGQRPRRGLWCVQCTETHRRRGARNRPSQDMIRRTVFGLGEAFGLLDSEGRVIMEDAA